MKNALLFACLLISATLSAQTITDSTQMPEITFEKLTHDFGTLPKARNTTTRFTFRNTGKSPLIISNCSRSCGCTTPTCPTEPILPGKQGFIDVHYDSLRVGAFTKTVTVSSNAKSNNVVLKITGNIVEEAVPSVPVDDKKSMLSPKQ